MSDRLIIEFATPIARQAVRRFQGYVDWQDVRSDLFVYLYENPEKIAIIEADDDQDGDRSAVLALERELRNRAQRFCRREKAGRAGYSADDEYFYTPDHLGALLKEMFSPESGPPVVSMDDVRSAGNAAEGGNWMAMLADVQLAYSRLDGEDREVLWQREGLGLLFREMMLPDPAVPEGWLSPQACSSRHRRAMKRLQDLLGGPRPKDW